MIGGGADFLRWCSIFGIPVGGNAPGGNNTFLAFASAPILVNVANSQDLFTIAMPTYDFFVPKTLSIIVTAATAITQSPTLSVGTNGTDYDNLLVQTPLTMLTSVQQIFQVSPNVGNAIAAGSLVRTKISLAGIATALSLAFILTGNGINI